ncbi:uncharacterized protein FPRO_15919 [Fusarium proliferatum ET1]|uniref:Uncharacterized protein n=1 Tax=Fusarium proliferatum (strain ET1) TaxID=1227346 RepID=A0A1L7WAF0_FUSPR|nr:uncharacterized protein FPRO_15919 [Fusarium proliferatum ET1]CZR49560.1 uncharacterized protein FPRO_15919 [Fusarium proliferatum ET1]
MDCRTAPRLCMCRCPMPAALCLDRAGFCCELGQHLIVEPFDILSKSLSSSLFSPLHC